MNVHKSVFRDQVIHFLNIQKGKLYIDATINGGGHAKEILNRGGKVLGIDADSKVVEELISALNLKKDIDSNSASNKYLRVVQSNFKNIKKICQKFGVWETPGIIFDLGLSSNQLDDSTRGFSFQKNGPLDMRFDQNLQVTAADLVNGLNEGELNELFFRYGEEYDSRSISRAIVKTRIKSPIKTTIELADLVKKVKRSRGKIHPATKVFQALRIAVNDEINNLRNGLEEASTLLEKNGRLVVISFHSIEDRNVKNFIKSDNTLRSLTLKPIVASTIETEENPRSRSAKMRVAEKI